MRYQNVDEKILHLCSVSIMSLYKKKKDLKLGPLIQVLSFFEVFTYETMPSFETSVDKEYTCTGCLRKKYGEADYQYFENGKTLM